MANVTIKWLKQNIEKFYCFGGQIDLNNLADHTSNNTFETTLTRKGVKSVGQGQYSKKFHVLVPGAGWADCFAFLNNPFHQDDLLDEEYIALPEVDDRT